MPFGPSQRAGTRLLAHAAGVCLLLAGVCCRPGPSGPPSGPPVQEGEGETEGEGEPPPAATPVYTYQIVRVFPHDTEAFTQGLVYEEGMLLEGTGLHGVSSLRRVALETGAVIQQIDLDKDYFGEGIAVVGDRIIQLTWRENTGFVYDRQSFALLGQFSYATEGWGLTYDGRRLIMSDGSHVLHFLDPETFEVLGTIKVRDKDRYVTMLNELEMVNGELFANVWQSDYVVRIDPGTGNVTGWINLKGLLASQRRGRPPDVLNGIAYDAAGDRLFVTGKNWPYLFEIDLAPAPKGATPPRR